MIVITSGKKYIDIDAYASGIAYRELLKLEGIDSKFVSTGIINYSVTDSLLKLPFSVDNYKLKTEDIFIIVDVSNKEFFEDFVVEENIIELIDHHSGYEDYWYNILNEKAQIDKIGSVATIIVEKYEEKNLLNKMNFDIAKLLMGAILDNTLNFCASITVDRDKIAFRKLESLTQEKDFTSIYFGEVQKKVEDDLVNSIINDLKIEVTSKYLPKVLGQLTIYDIDSILNNIEVINDTMNKYGKDWLINIISLKENKSYILCSNTKVKCNIQKLFNKDFIDNIILHPAILRKEIIKLALDYEVKEK